MLNVRCLFALLAFMFLGSIHRAPAGTASDVWILSGQSNACGRGKLPGPTPDPSVQMIDLKTRKWITAKEPLAMMNGSVGPWLAAAIETAKGGIPVRVLGYASGGKPISFWKKGAQGWQQLEANVKAYGKGAGVFLWYQGETDASQGMKEDEYRTKLTDLVHRVRALSGNPQLLTVIIQLGLWKNKTGDFMPIREAQRRFVCSDPQALLVPALGRKAGDYVHLSTPGYTELGREISHALMGVRYKRKGGSWPGPVMDLAVTTGKPDSVFVHFAEVKKLGGVLAEDFGALDASGLVKCVKAQAGLTRVALTFERALKPPAKIVYGFGQNPQATLVDEAGYRAPAVQVELVKGSIPKEGETKAPNGAGALRP